MRPGTWWLDEARRDWSDEALAATGLDRDHMASLVEGSQASGTVRAEIARRWGLRSDVVVAGGAGDAAAGAVGLGAIEDGSAFISLGTSGQLFVTTETFSPAPEAVVHSFCHAVPGRWFQMAAMLNGASCLSWAADLLKRDIGELLRETEAAYPRTVRSSLPALSRGRANAAQRSLCARRLLRPFARHAADGSGAGRPRRCRLQFRRCEAVRSSRPAQP